MADKPQHPEDEGSKWITVQGRKVEIDPDGDPEAQIREKLPKDARGEKEKNTKQAMKKMVARSNLQKSKFNFRDEVLYDDLTKSGTIAGFDGQYVQIFTKGVKLVRHANNVFKKSEMLGDNHWDTMTIEARTLVLKDAGVSTNYIKHDWTRIPAILQDKIQKDGTPAGTGITSSTEGVWNPVNQDKPVSQKIKEAKQNNEEKQRD